MINKQKVIDATEPQSGGNNQKMLMWAIQTSFLAVHIKAS